MTETPSNIVAKIRHIIKNHRSISQEEERSVTAWLERILKKPENESEKSSILQYARYLEYQLKYKNLTHPFNKHPPQSIAPLSEVITEQLDKHNKLEAQQAAITTATLKNNYKPKDKTVLCDWGQNTLMQDTKKSESNDQCTENTKYFKQIIQEGAINKTTLAEFLTNIIPFTDDNADLIREIASNELKTFRELVFRIFTDRIQQVDKILSSRQSIMKYKYIVMEQHLLNRAKIAQNHLKQLLPGFNYNDYVFDDNYIRNILLEVDKKDSDQANICEANFLSTENSLKEQQFKLKFLKDEIRRREEENEELMDELNNLMVQLYQSIKDQQEKSKQNMKRNKDLKDKLAGLKITTEENQLTLDKLFLKSSV